MHIFPIWLEDGDAFVLVVGDCVVAVGQRGDARRALQLPDVAAAGAEPVAIIDMMKKLTQDADFIKLSLYTWEIFQQKIHGYRNAGNTQLKVALQ